MAATLPAAVCERLQLLPTYFDVTPYTDSTPLPIWCSVTQNQALKEVSAYIIWHRVHTWGLQGKCHKLSFFTLLCTFTNNIHVSVKNPSAEGTCDRSKEQPSSLLQNKQSIAVFMPLLMNENSKFTHLLLTKL